MDLSREYLTVDDPVAVTVYRKTGRTSYAAGVIVNFAFRTALDQKTLDPLLADRQEMITLYREPLNNAGFTATPRPGDVIEMGGVRHTVDAVEHRDRDSNGVQRFRCKVTRE